LREFEEIRKRLREFEEIRKRLREFEEIEISRQSRYLDFVQEFGLMTHFPAISGGVVLHIFKVTV
jgi:hypothetical protein